MIRKATTAEMESWQRNVRGDAVAREPVLMNAESVVTLHDTGYIELSLRYRKRQFRVPPIPYRAGLQLLVLDRHLARLQAKLADDERNNIHDASSLRALTELGDTLTEMVRIFYALVRPVTLWDRLTWRARANPFADAEPQEIKMLRDFFCAARTRCRVNLTTPIRAPRRHRSTLPMSWRSLSLGSRGGWMSTGTPAAGGITVLGLPQ